VADQTIRRFVFRYHRVLVEKGSGSRGSDVLQNRKKYGPKHDAFEARQWCASMFLFGGTPSYCHGDAIGVLY